MPSDDGAMETIPMLSKGFGNVGYAIPRVVPIPQPMVMIRRTLAWSPSVPDSPAIVLNVL